MKNKFEVLEDRAFYTDSVYFEIVNELVMISIQFGLTHFYPGGYWLE